MSRYGIPAAAGAFSEVAEMLGPFVLKLRCTLKHPSSPEGGTTPAVAASAESALRRLLPEATPVASPPGSRRRRHSRRLPWDARPRTKPNPGPPQHEREGAEVIIESRNEEEESSVTVSPGEDSDQIQGKGLKEIEIAMEKRLHNTRHAARQARNSGKASSTASNRTTGGSGASLTTSERMAVNTTLSTTSESPNSKATGSAPSPPPVAASSANHHREQSSAPTSSSRHRTQHQQSGKQSDSSDEDNEDEDEEMEDDAASSPPPPLVTSPPSTPATPTGSAPSSSTSVTAAVTQSASPEQMYEGFQAWALRTYGDSAKTKTVTRKKYQRILKILKGEEQTSAENSKFRFWVKAKGFKMGLPPGHPQQSVHKAALAAAAAKNPPEQLLFVPCSKVKSNFCCITRYGSVMQQKLVKREQFNRTPLLSFHSALSHRLGAADCRASPTTGEANEVAEAAEGRTGMTEEEAYATDNTVVPPPPASSEKRQRGTVPALPALPASPASWGKRDSPSSHPPERDGIGACPSARRRLATAR
ncbi:hypothetical protein HPB51_020918 [Rhipicephalus microplus]|uniref:Uncharacterized protein n=1 Tax=Rhipicephalus microplus TaxID=6941 RepID=A0A9J6ECK7_RHIMP|nr:hypothetical protein HPB51_020918 [Rhipicephalus microplus]